MSLAVHEWPVVAVRGDGPPVDEALRQLAAEPGLHGRCEPHVPAAGDRGVWGLLVLGDEPDPGDLRARYPRLAAVSFIGRPINGGPSPLNPPAEERVADNALGRLLLTVRRPLEFDALVRSGGWRPASAPAALHGSTVGVWGDGSELDATARRLEACECQVVSLFDHSGGASSPAAEMSAVVVLPSGRARWSKALVPEAADGGVVTVVVEEAALEGPTDARVDLGYGAAIRRAVGQLAAIASEQSR